MAETQEYPAGPDAFADRIAARYRNDIPDDGGSLGLHDEIIARHERLGHQLDEEMLGQISRGEALGVLVERFYTDLVAFCPAPLRDFCADHVRVRGVRSYAIEGAVLASGDGSYVVIVTTSLLTYLNKVKKFILAENDLSRVTHCNRMPSDRLTPRLVRGMLDEVIDNFRQGEARGPMLLLDELGTMTVHLMLDFQEAFVVAHEIGHLLADNLLAGVLAHALNESFGSLPHRSEYLADMIGFCLARQRPLAGFSAPENEAQHIDHEAVRVSSICEFFEILELAYPYATESHPAPGDRAANLLATFYGEHFGAHYNAVRAGELAHFDWVAQFRAGVRPSMLAQIVFDLLNSPAKISELLALIEADGPEALATIPSPDAQPSFDR